ncbi:MAG: Penicillin-binding protein 1A [Flavobacteriales bacterium]|nr:MAG: Penicillin-binding protein 1A [Flavobacteriales bacterium]|tara:strand:+ start:4635 stop:6941 length:2307 start_codon:yes stop_codon:yes gene_type:complete
MSRKKGYGRFKRLIWVAFGSITFGIIAIFGAASLGLLGPMPDFRQLENPKTNLATQIISADDTVLGKFYFNDNRTPISFREIPTAMIEALVATEDERFYSHSGIDFRGTARAVFYLGKKGGASTITQQLARQLFVGVRSQNTFQAIVQKIKEWVIAIRLERRYTKNEIITMYLNIYDFNYNADGLRSASSIYFSKKPIELDLSEAAMLVGMLKNSSLYNPLRRPEMVRSRRNIVYQQMLRNKLITEEQRDSLAALPITLDFNPQSHREGIATYFRTYLQQFMRSWISKHPKEDGTFYNLYLDGLRIYTTIDSRLQTYAEDAVTAHMSNLQKEFFRQNVPEYNDIAPFLDVEKEDVENIMQQAKRRSERWRKMKALGHDEETILASFEKPTQMEVFGWNGDIDTIMTPTDSIRYYKHFLRAGMMSMEPQTGHVKAWVGGINYRHFQFDHVMQGKRQIGSTFKPFVYASAIDQLKVSPCDSLPDGYYCVEPAKFGAHDAWCPKNSGDRYIGKRTLKNALANSVNTISARLIDKVGTRPVVNLVRNLGVSSPIPNVPAIALGSADLSVYEMVGAYSSFANKGIYVKPVVVTRIEDKNGTVIYQTAPETKDVLSEESAYVTLKLLEGVTESGSGVRLRHRGAEKTNPIFRDLVTGYPYEFDNPIAGKTGTTQNQSDGWFIGMVPNLATGVWVGGEDRSIHFETIAYGQGATMALPIWANYMKACYADSTLVVSKDEFMAPDVVSIPLDCDSLSVARQQKSFFEDEDLSDLGL